MVRQAVARTTPCLLALFSIVTLLATQRLLAERFGVIYHERTVGKILHKLGFSQISARPRHPAQDERIVAEFKKIARPR